jgi:hypothetical protein
MCARSWLKFNRHEVTGRKLKSAYRFPAHGGHHRESCGPAGPGGRGADEDRTADGCALGCGGVFGWLRGWRRRRGRHLLSDVLLNSLQCRKVLDYLFLLGSELFYSAPHTSRLNAKRSSCCTGPGEVVATTSGFVVDVDNNQASVGARAMTISFAASP